MVAAVFFFRKEISLLKTLLMMMNELVKWGCVSAEVKYSSFFTPFTAVWPAELMNVNYCLASTMINIFQFVSQKVELYFKWDNCCLLVALSFCCAI